MSRAVSRPPNLLDNLDAGLGGLSQDALGLALDFDGTISEFVPLLDDAVIFPAVVAPLRSLSRKLRLTAVVSGRAAADVRRRVDMDEIVFVGNHGAEYIVDGSPDTAPGAVDRSDSIQAILDRMRELVDIPGLVWENKGFSASIHYRMADDEIAALQRIQAALEAVPEIADMEVFRGNKILEIRARNHVNKGYALRRLIRDRNLKSVLFLGDDTTDADALRTLRRHRQEGLIGGLAIAVIQDGTPASVLDNADYSLNGVPEVAAFLRHLDAAMR